MIAQQWSLSNLFNSFSPYVLGNNIKANISSSNQIFSSFDIKIELKKKEVHNNFICREKSKTKGRSMQLDEYNTFNMSVEI